MKKKMSTPKTLTGAALAYSVILSVARSEWSQPLDVAIACFSIEIPLLTGYFLREAKIESPHGDWWRNVHYAGWFLSIVTTIFGVAAMFHHLSVHNATCFGLAVILAVLLILVRAHADEGWGTGRG